MRPIEAPVVIVPYDPAWPARFEQEAQVLERTLATWLVGRVEHIGSTAIPGLAAKPVIDIMGPVRTLAESHPAIGAAAELGYSYAPYQAELEHWFCKPSPQVRTHHLHLVPANSAQWIGAIAFRNYLRAHPADMVEYETLKRRLAQQYHFDREAYTAAKRPFISRTTEMAVEMGYARSVDPEERRTS